ncbi:hypothetical protein [Novosphingobium olei]|uniref:hypothetical protein n=1 Tax=Novosphingobium olei TaxID=2728851 RepID=UPI00308BA7CF|nr:hypothetical protein NSDW_09630 [Novosphingobium olei]
MLPDDLTPLHVLACVGAMLLAVSIFAGWRDRRNLRREDLDRVSLINWRQIAAVTSIIAIVALSAAAHLWFTA